MVRTVDAALKVYGPALGLALVLCSYPRLGHAAEVKVVVDVGLVDSSDLESAIHAEVQDDILVRVVRVVGEAGDVRIEVARGIDVRSRVISLADVPQERHARVLALAAADLLHDMPTLPVAKAQEEPPPAPHKVVPPLPPAPRGVDVEGHLGGFLRYHPGTGKAYVGVGGKMSLCFGIVCPHAALQLGASNSDTSLGSVTATLFRAGGGVDLQFRPRPWLMLTTGPTVLVGTFGASARPLSGARADGFTAPSLDAKWSGLAAFRTGYLVWLYAELSGGGTAFGGSALVGSREQASDRGAFLEGSIGIRFAGDHDARSP